MVRNGRYGDPPRQLWRCVPGDGSRAHTFAGRLPRQFLDEEGTCPSCESHLSAHQGPATPPSWAFPVREAAAALVAVASGQTYTEAAGVARVRAGRRPMAPGLGAQLVANWVEVLTPVVAAPHAEVGWPETVVCDSTSFLVTNTRTGVRSLAFSVLGVWGYDTGAARGRLRALRAFHRAGAHEWAEVFAALPGVPVQVVCDHAGAIHNAVAATWPPTTTRRASWSPVAAEPFVRWCEHHLRERALGHLRTYGLDTDPRAQRLLGRAFRSPQGWAAFCRFAAGHIQLNAWCQSAELWVRPQSAHRRRLPPHHANGAVEQAIQQTRQLLERRAYSFRNAQRTNQLLELMRLRINGVADEVAFAEAIRAHLDAGMGLGRQLACVDAGTRPPAAGAGHTLASLRS